jgi:hypothetical protein
MQIIYRSLPEVARPTHSVMRHQLTVSRGRRRVWLGRILITLSLICTVVLGFLVTTNFGTTSLESSLNPFEQVYLILFWPLVVIQIGLRLAAFGGATGILQSEKSRETWDMLKITTEGTNLLFRVRWWAAFFHRLRFGLLILIGARIVFVIGFLYTFSANNGRYLDLMIGGTTPLGRMADSDGRTLSFTAIALGVLLIAMQLTVAFILPFVSLAFDAALGALVGVMMRSRWIGLLGQVLMLVFRAAISAFALWYGALALGYPIFGLSRGTLQQDFADVPLLGFLRGIGGIFLGVTEGDQGLTLLYIPHVQQIFADFEYGVLIGLFTLLYTIFLTVMAVLTLRLAIRIANRPERS